MNKDNLSNKKDDFLMQIEEARRINAAIKRVVRNIKDFDTTGVNLLKAPTRKRKDIDLF